MPLKLNGTNSVAAPAYAGDDADTGLQCGTNELNLVTGGTARVKIASDGAVQLLSSTGIDFSGIQTNASGMTSEILDSYEEGTWTPVYEGSTTAGTYTYGSRFANYTKIGNTVHLQCSINNITTTSAGTGSARITGLPFTAKGNTGTYQGPMRLSRFNVADDAVTIQVSLNGNSSTATLTETRDGQSAASVAVTDRMDNNSDVYFNITYFVA